MIHTNGVMIVASLITEYNAEAYVQGHRFARVLDFTTFSRYIWCNKHYYMTTIQVVQNTAFFLLAKIRALFLKIQ